MDILTDTLLDELAQGFDEAMNRVTEAGSKIEELYQSYPLPEWFKDWWIDNRHRYIKEEDDK